MAETRARAARPLSLERLLRLPSTQPVDLTPDGSRVLLLSNRSGTNQLYLQALDGGAPVRLTDLEEPVLGRFVPGNETILLRVDEGGNERHQLFLLDATPRASPRPLVVEPDYLHVSPVCTRDGRTLAYGCNRRNGVDLDVIVRSLETGAERTVFAPGGWSEPAAFSPDGRLLAVQRLTDRPGDNELHLVDVETGAAREALPHDDDAYVGVPVWLADGTAFHVAASVGRDTVAIARASVTGSWEYVLEDEWDLECLGDRAGRRLVVTANEDGWSRVRVHEPETLALVGDVPLPGRGVVTSVVPSEDGRRLALGFWSSLEPGDAWLWAEETGETRRVTRGIEPELQHELVEPELHRFTSFDGESIPAFLWRPRVRGGAAPVVVDIHGGPEGQRRPQWNPVIQYLVSAGYAVTSPNVRGSTGYGKRYEHLDDVYRRLDSVRDLVALHDWLGTDDAIDASRTALFGGSYGGYMVLAGLAFHPARWAAGIDVVGIANLVTFLEHTAEWRRAFREREYGSLEHDREFLLSVSPMTRVDAIRAPLLVIHGANDPRVPVGEARQIHEALTARGVRCELLVYDDEGHGLQKLKNRVDAYPRVVAFLDAVLQRTVAER